MRPGQQNRRSRGRNNNNNGNGGGGNNNNRRHQNPLARSYESSGPDVKIRGNAQHIAEKYGQLARDALSAGDRVLAESYLQHAEHYNRIIAAALAQQAQSAEQNRRDWDDDGDEDGDDDSDGGSADSSEDSQQAAAQPAPRQHEARAQEGRGEHRQNEGRQNEGRQNRNANPPRRPVAAEAAQPEIEGVPAEFADDAAGLARTLGVAAPREDGDGGFRRNRPRRPRRAFGEAGSADGEVPAAEAAQPVAADEPAAAE